MTISKWTTNGVIIATFLHKVVTLGMNKGIPSRGVKGGGNLLVAEARRKAAVKKAALRTSPKKADDTVSKEFLFSYRSVDDKDVLIIIDAVRAGISQADFNRLMDDTPFSLAEWASYLQLSERTIQRNQKEKKAFQPIQSERIVEVAMLYKYGVDVFGSKESFDTWLESKSIALGGRAPKELLDTKFGIGMVRDELGRIEHGVLA